MPITVVPTPERTPGLPFAFDQSGGGGNTAVSYLYRDASNYKERETVVLAGRLSGDQARRMAAAMFDGDGFIPAKVGLDDLQERLGSWDDDTDHPWHEIEEVSYTARPDDGMTVEEFVARWPAAADGWDAEQHEAELRGGPSPAP